MTSESIEIELEEDVQACMVRLAVLDAMHPDTIKFMDNLYPEPIISGSIMHDYAIKSVLYDMSIGKNISEDDRYKLVDEYVRTRTDEATVDHINELFGEVTNDNMTDVAFAALLNDGIIYVLKKRIEEEGLQDLPKQEKENKEDENA